MAAVGSAAFAVFALRLHQSADALRLAFFSRYGPNSAFPG
jgi:hypothetical protein